MHHPGCSYLLQRENSPQRPGEKIRAEPYNFTAVHLTITDASPPPDPSPSLSLFVDMFSSVPYTAELGRFGADSLTALLSNSHRTSSGRMRSVRLGLLWGPQRAHSTRGPAATERSASAPSRG
ncbi:Na(+)/H(+) antiporter NhaA [Dissostichus eleginoides]|uniref:Na(+)/H(+) antiporter NhaA n=1 Tax=Dissostichus eleginoides TaxID=100907 RepID=A0AAD9ETF2_DISEL|nr:Na(+)/H(+) antiporter NhaA [Dissostichus eleginoides]